MYGIVYSQTLFSYGDPYSESMFSIEGGGGGIGFYNIQEEEQSFSIVPESLGLKGSAYTLFRVLLYRRIQLLRFPLAVFFFFLLFFWLLAPFLFQDSLYGHGMYFSIVSCKFPPKCHSLLNIFRMKFSQSYFGAHLHYLPFCAFGSEIPLV